MFIRITQKTKPLALLIVAVLALAAVACSDTQQSMENAPPVPTQTAPPTAQPTEPPAPTAAPQPTTPPAPQPTEPPALSPAPATIAMTQQPDASPTLDSLPASAVYGDYAVGTRMGFAVDNRQRFDPWNSAYASPAYRDTLRRIETSGQTRTVIFQVWYPAEADTSAGRQNGARSPYPASDGRRANFMDSFFQDDAVAAQLSSMSATPPQLIHTRYGETLADASPAGRQEIFEHMGQRALTMPQGAWVDAAPADGKFPLIILAHGLGGSHSMWTSFAEFLASHGYVVAAPTFISDGSMPLVFHDEDSPFANSATPEEVQQAYAVIAGEFKVLPNFYQMMFGVDVSGGFDSFANFNPAEAQITPGGIERATTMMQNLFRQRVADVGLLAHTMRMLGEEPSACRAALNSMGATSAARNLCGLLNGRIDGARVGLSGHSLGSMTAQLGLNHLPGISAAMGFNNAPPFTWTPEEMYGGGETAAGLPVGSRKPTLIMIGDEDDFVQNVFVGLFQASVAAAGGDPSIAFPLDAERALPDRAANPQPVAFSAYQRAVSDRIFAIVRDIDHGTLVDDNARNTPWPAFQRGALLFGISPQRVRKPTGETAFGPPQLGAADPFNLLDWAQLGDGSEAYMPHLIRDWYARAWFDWYLKDDEDAHRRLQNADPFGSLTSAMSEVR